MLLPSKFIFVVECTFVVLSLRFIEDKLSESESSDTSIYSSFLNDHLHGHRIHDSELFFSHQFEDTFTHCLLTSNVGDDKTNINMIRLLCRQSVFTL